MRHNQKRPRPSYYPVPLTAAMNNVFAWRLGKIAEEAGDPTCKDVGDYIDRGLILRRLLEEAGFYIMVTDAPKNIPHLSDLVQPWIPVEEE